MSAGDAIMMGKYPITPYAISAVAIRNSFEAWRVKSHTVKDILRADTEKVRVDSTAGNTHDWTKYGAAYVHESYWEIGVCESYVYDRAAGAGVDEVGLETGSSSQPTNESYLKGSHDGDSGLVDVEIYAP